MCLCEIAILSEGQTDSGIRVDFLRNGNWKIGILDRNFFFLELGKSLRLKNGPKIITKTSLTSCLDFTRSL